MFKNFSWIEFFLKILSLLIGFSLGVRVLGVVYQSGFWFSGMVNDFMLVKFGLTEIFSALAILVWVFSGGKGIMKIDVWCGVFFVLIACFNIYFALDVYLAFWKWILFFLNLITVRFILIKYWKSFVIGVLGAVLVNILVALLQIIFSKSLGLDFLGESKIGVEIWNVAKINFGDKVFLRGYGLFEHANVFGYFCLISFWLIDLIKINYPRSWVMLLKGFFLFGLIISGSRLMFLACLTGCCYGFLRKKNRNITWIELILIGVGFLYLFIFRGIDFGGRGEFLFEALNMIGKFINGVGFGNYLIGVLEFVNYRVDFWSLQFVHNLYVLIIAELGVFISFVGLGFGVWRFFKRLNAGKKLNEMEAKIMISFLIVGLGDHLIWTNQRAFLLSLFLIMAIFNEEKVFLDIRK